MRCPHCRNKVLQKSGAVTRLRTHGALTFSDSGMCKAKCYWCRNEVEIPVQIQEGAPITEERFFVARGRGG